MAETPHICQLYVVIEVGESAVEHLSAALLGSDLASILIVPPAGGKLEAAAVQPLVKMAQRAQATALILADAALARTLRADGVHLPATDDDLVEAYAHARGIVGHGGIVGCDAGVSRDAAMTLAEHGADYVAFGAPRSVEEREHARQGRDDLIQWWAEIFQVPCVAFDVKTAEEAETLARMRADFVAVALTAGQQAAATRALVSDIATAIAFSEAAG